MLIIRAMRRLRTYAGVYSSLEPKFKLNDQYFNVFRDESLFPLRQIGTEYVQNNWQKFYALMGTGLDLSKLVPSRDPKTPEPLTVEQRLNLGVCLLRLRRPLDAIQVLRPSSKPQARQG